MATKAVSDAELFLRLCDDDEIEWEKFDGLGAIDVLCRFRALAENADKWRKALDDIIATPDHPMRKKCKELARAAIRAAEHKQKES